MTAGTFKPTPTAWYQGICQGCQFKDTPTVLEPCWSCMSNEELALARNGDKEPTMYNFTPVSGEKEKEK